MSIDCSKNGSSLCLSTLSTHPLSPHNHSITTFCTSHPLPFFELDNSNQKASEMSGETYREAECMEAAESESFYDLYIATEGLLCPGSVCFRDAVKDGYCEECNPNKSEVPATRKLSPKKKVAKTSPRVVVATPSRERKGKHCAERVQEGGFLNDDLLLQVRGQTQADHAWTL